MSESKKKLSFFSEFIIFLVFVLIAITILNKFDESSYTNIIESVAYQDVNSENKTYIKNIKDEYGINIVYGDSTKNLAQSVEANVQSSQEEVNANLKEIENELKKYPAAVFEIFKGKKYPLKIVLVDSFNNNNLALTSKSNLNDFKIYISNTKKFSKALHHEMYHVLEYYMSDTHKYLYKSWYHLNPEGFRYVSDISKLDDEYVYMKLTDGEQNVSIYDKVINPYFVTLYSKTTEREDRAEVFSELMIAKSKPKYLASGQNILNKALYIDSTIKECITNDEFYYTKYVN